MFFFYLHQGIRRDVELLKELRRLMGDPSTYRPEGEEENTPDMDPEEIVRPRRRLGMTQGEFGGRLGVSKPTVVRIEGGGAQKEQVKKRLWSLKKQLNID